MNEAEPHSEVKMLHEADFSLKFPIDPYTSCVKTNRSVYAR